MSEMVERVARAISVTEACGEYPCGMCDRPDGCRAMARAAIAAMREEDLVAELSWRRFCKLYVENEDGCWIWAGPVDRRDGYGRFSSKAAHRISYERLIGEIPAGMVIDHICRRRACVNPKHMRVVTNAENILCGEGITARHARATECGRGHPFDEENTYYRPDGLRMCRACQLERGRAYRSRKRAMIDAALEH